MSQTRYLKGLCSHCAGRIEFPAEAIGMMVDCPHCGKSTELLLEAQPEPPPAIPKRALIYTIIALFILAGGFAGALVALHRAQRLYGRAAKTTRASAPTTNASAVPAETDSVLSEAARAGFGVSPISLEKTAGSSLVYATGGIANLTARQRFGVKVEVELLDAGGKKIGGATDYQQVLEPNAQWQFKALVVDSKPASARLANIKEDQ